MTRYAMAIDLARCVSCNRCAMACKQEHNLPDTVWWNKCKTTGGEHFYTPGGVYPNELDMSFYTMSCQHCKRPLCMAACPTGATTQREDGIVEVDYESCIGCESCMQACPYEGVRTHVQNPTWALDFEVGDARVRKHIDDAVEKCTFCVERIDRGERPACVDICFAYARYFGDVDDPDSEISKVLAEREYQQFNTDVGTEPCVYYLV